MKRLASIGVVAFIVGIFTVQPLFAAVMPPSTAGIGARPANPDPERPRTQSIFIYSLAGGASHTDQAFVSNGSDEEATIELYMVDGVTANTGTFTCREAVENRADVGSWVTLDKTEVTLPSRTNTLVDFTVNVPEGADVGEHNGCLVAQRKGDEGQVSGSVRIKTRQAVRMAIVVPGDIHRSVSIAHFAAAQDGLKGQKYQITLTNDGNVSADVQADVVLRDIFGKQIATSGGQYPVMPNQSLDLNFDGDAKPFFGGLYFAKASIAYDKRAGVYGVEDKSNLLYAESGSAWVFVWPSIWVFVGLGLLLIGFIIWRRRRYLQAKKKTKKKSTKKNSTRGRGATVKKGGRQADEILWAPYVIEEGDTIEKLARRHGVAKTTIARENKIRSPYTLTPGKTISVPLGRKSK